MEFAEYRKYVTGDDIRRIDWRVYARSDRFYIKEFEADTNLRCCLIVDSSGSMGYSSAEETKLDYAVKLASVLAYLTVQQGDAVGLYAGSDQLEVAIPPSRRPAQVRLVHEYLAQLDPSRQTGFAEHVHELAERVPQRALVILFSDLLDDPEKLIDSWRHLCHRKHEVVVFHLFDRQELDLKFEQPLRFEDMEGSETLIAEPNMIAERYQQVVAKHRRLMEEGAASCQIDYHAVVTDEDYESVLVNFLSRRLRPG